MAAILRYFEESTGTWEVLDAVEEGSGFDTKVVDTLPTEGISSSTIYMIASEDTDDTNKYKEYIYVNGSWERLDSLDTSDEVINKNLGDESEIEDLFK